MLLLLICKTCMSVAKTLPDQLLNLSWFDRARRMRKIYVSTWFAKHYTEQQKGIQKWLIEFNNITTGCFNIMFLDCKIAANKISTILTMEERQNIFIQTQIIWNILKRIVRKTRKVTLESRLTSSTKEAWKCIFPPFLGNYDRPTNQPTDRQGHWEVTLSITDCQH